MALFSSALCARSYNQGIINFNKSKQALLKIHLNHPYTLYCNCKFIGKTVDLKSCGYKPYKDPKRAVRLEWEHVVPAQAFGQSFKEWRDGASSCIRGNKKFKGRKCAQQNPEYAKMEADLYNLYPEVGELNGLRSNFSMTEFGKNDRRPSSKTFGECRAIVSERKFEPMDAAKGVVARTYMYMDQAYPNRGIISQKNRKLFEVWDKLYPVTPWECQRAKSIEKIQGNINPVLAMACK